MAHRKQALGDRIRIAREKREISQRALARAMKVEPDQMSKWESGRRTPRLRTLCKIADLLGTTLDYLCLGVEPRPLGSRNSHP